MKVWINKKIVDADKARISVFDRGYMYGDGLFETMRGYAGKIFRLDDHMDRLFSALKVMRIRHPYTKKNVKAAIHKILKINRLTSAYVRLTITRGEGRFGMNFSDVFTPNMVIVAKEFGEYPIRMYSRGINAKVVEVRLNESSAITGIKSLNFLNYILARFMAKEDGFDEAILMNTKDHIAEGATSNVFTVKDGALITPSLDSGILPGITRKLIIGIAKTLKIRVKERPIFYKELLAADEVFLTNSLIEVLPVVKVDYRKIGNGRVGDITKLLHISYQKHVIRETLR